MSYISELRKVIGTRPIIVVGAVVLVYGDDQLLLQQRTDNGLWGLPGGIMELGETLENTATRELYEETGLTASSLQLFHVFSGQNLYYQYPNGDEVYNVVGAFLCQHYKGVPQADRIETECLQFFNLDEIPQEISPPDQPIIAKFLEKYLKKDSL